MRYLVNWEHEARIVLQQLYNGAPDKEGFLLVLERIDLELSANPLEAGESREAGTRILFKYPLILWFDIDERMREVVIVEVREWSR